MKSTSITKGLSTRPHAPLAVNLADRFTVVAYDRRGFSRSELDGPLESRFDRDVEDATHGAEFAEELAKLL